MPLPPPPPKYLIDRTRLELIILYFIIHRGKEMMCLHSVPVRNIINRRDNDFNRARNIKKYKISSGDVSPFAAVVNRTFFPPTTVYAGREINLRQSDTPLTVAGPPLSYNFCWSLLIDLDCCSTSARTRQHTTISLWWTRMRIVAVGRWIIFQNYWLQHDTRLQAASSYGGDENRCIF